MESPRYSQQEIQRLMQKLAEGTLSDPEKVLLTELAGKDPFLADAIAGLSEGGDHHNALADIRSSLEARQRNRPRTPLLYWGAAAAVLIAIVTTVFLFQDNSLMVSDTAMVKEDTQVSSERSAESEGMDDNSVRDLTELLDRKAEQQRVSDSIDQLQSPPRPPASTKPKQSIEPNARLQATPDMPQRTSNQLTEMADTYRQEGESRKEISEQTQPQPRSEQEDEAISIVGSRSDAKDYYLDGVRVSGELAEETRQIRGQVTDAQTGEPLIGASVFLQPGGQATATDINGNFTLPLSDKKATIFADYPGYKDLTLIVPDSDSILIGLSSESAVLDEVVVTDMRNSRSQKKATATDAAIVQGSGIPEGGWDAFQAYLVEKQNEIAQGLDNDLPSGLVKLKFEIDRKGTPVDISVLKSGGAQLDARAIYLLQNGPRWIPGDQKSGRVVEYTFKFPLK